MKREVDRQYWAIREELKAALAAPLPGGRGFQARRDTRIHYLCSVIATYDTPKR